MKKRIGFLALCIGLMVNVLPVQADLIWEPMGDSFYSEHMNECTYVNRTYIANGPDGQVVVYENPESDEQVTVWERGSAVYISHAYEDEDGVIWGIYDNGEVSQSGWVRMEHMALKYDSEAFMEEYAEQIVEEEVVVGSDAEMVIGFWKYPGSKEKNEVKISKEGLTLSKTFVDEEGHKWAYVNYFRAMKRYWVCVDAPSANFEELYPNEAPKRGIVLEGTDIAIVEGSQSAAEAEQEKPDKTVEQENTDKTAESVKTEKEESGVTEESKNQVPFVVAIVAGVVAVTGGLLVLLKRSFGAKK